MSVNELSFILAKHDNVPSASNIPSRIHHNCGAQPPPEHTTSASFLASHSTPATATNLPRYPLQAHVNNRDYPPPQVVDTTLAPNFTDAGPGSPRTHIATGEGSTLNVMPVRQTLDTVASAALSAVISPDASMSDAVSLQISPNNARAEIGGLPMPATAVEVSHGANEIIAVIKYALFLLVIGTIIAIRILA